MDKLPMEQPPAAGDPCHPDRLFRYHRPTEAQVFAMRQVREGCYKLGVLVCAMAPATPERTLALRALHLAQQHTNFAIVANAPAEPHPSEGGNNKPGGEAVDRASLLKLLIVQTPIGPTRTALENALRQMEADAKVGTAHRQP